MICIEATKGQTCSACERTFKAGQLIFQDSSSKFHCIEGCFKKADPNKKTTSSWATPGGKALKHTPNTTAKISKYNLTYNPMSDKLRNDINKMVKGA